MVVGFKAVLRKFKDEFKISQLFNIDYNFFFHVVVDFKVQKRNA